MRFVKRERSNPDKASLHFAICKKLGNGEADLAVNSFKPPPGRFKLLWPTPLLRQLFTLRLFNASRRFPSPTTST